MADKNKGKVAATTGNLQKSYFDVLGLCCSSEVTLVENILKSLEGVKEYSVMAPTRTVIVVHDAQLISQLQIVKALNQARLEANVRTYGRATMRKKKWPTPYAAGSGLLLLLSFLKYVYRPLRWLAVGSVAIGIIPIFLKAIASARNLSLDVNILALMAAIGTMVLRDYTEAGTIVFLFAVAEWLEARAGHKAQAVMSSLMSLTPQKAVIAETGEEVDVNEVKLNTVLAVKDGEVIPIDGIVVDGKCEVDEKTLTGESFPVPKEKESSVWAGTLNLNGYVSVRTTALADDCVVAKMTKLVEEAQNSKSTTQRFIDKCAKYYTPALVIISASLAIVPLAFRVHNRNHWFHLALVVLVSACPCSLILSTPVATFCALTKAATAGLLIKGGEYLETLAKIKVMAFDKTGTITRGEFVVNDFESVSDDVSADTLLYWVSSIESKSSHPMAAALVDYGRSHSIEPMPANVEEFQNYPGEGIHGWIDGKSIYIGSRKIGLRAGSPTDPTTEANKTRGQTLGYVYCEAKLAGIFSLSDVCRTGVEEAIKELKLLSIKTAMLTGDSQSAATRTQEQLGHALEAVHSELLPEDKARIIESFKKEGPTAMVGDGINDAPALATADIGISMGVAGSAIATETGQVILMSNDLRKVPKAIQLTRKAHRKVIENVFLSIMTKGAVIVLAIAGHPLVWAAALADVGTCLLVILNSMLLLQGTSNHAGKFRKSSSTSHGRKHGSNNSSIKTYDHEELQNCHSICKPGHLGVNSCKSKKCSESTERKNDCIGPCRFKETKHCNDGGCQMDNHDLEVNNRPKNCCSDQNGSTICMQKAEQVQAKCEKGWQHSTAQGEDFHCQTLTHQGVTNHCSHFNNSRACQRLTDNSNHFTNHCCEERVQNQINKESGEITSESCCIDQLQHSVLHHDLPKCCKGQIDPAQTTIDIHPAADHVDTTTKHGCLSSEKREIGGCCRSYMKECCHQQGCLPSPGFVGGLSEIVTE